MTTNQEDICKALMLHAGNKMQVIKAMIKLFPTLKQKDIEPFVKKDWNEEGVSTEISLRKLNYEQRVKLIMDLMERKNNGEIKHIFVHILKARPKNVSKGIENLIIGDQLPLRDQLRGRLAELVFANELYVRISRPGLMFEHKFLHWDISATHYIHLEYY